MRQGPRIKAFRKVKKTTSSGALREKDESLKLMAKSRSPADRGEWDERPQTRKNPLVARRKKVEKAKALSNLSASEKTEESSSMVSSQGRKSPPAPWRNKTIHTVIMGKNQGPHKPAEKFHTITNPPMKFANTRPRVDSGIGTSYPRQHYGIQNSEPNKPVKKFHTITNPPMKFNNTRPRVDSGKGTLYSRQNNGIQTSISRRVPRTFSPEINRLNYEKEDMHQRKSIGDYIGNRQSSIEASKKIDTLVSALAAMVPPCGSKSQLDMVVGTFASALKEKVCNSWNQQKRDKKVQGSELGSLDMQRGGQINSSTVMNPTESWVARCKGNAINQKRVPMVASTGSTRPSKLLPHAAVPQTPIVARRYGSTKIHEIDSDESGEKHEINYGARQGMKTMDKQDNNWNSNARKSLMIKPN